MKRFKNNKGVTGVDIAVSVSIIVITLGIVMAIYTSYSNKSKEIKRNSVATNLAMTVIEKIEQTDINSSIIKDDITSSGLQFNKNNKVNCGNYGIEESMLNAYSVTIKKIESSDALIKMVAFQIDVIVSYEIEDETKTVTLSTIKKYDNTGEAEKPNMADTKIEGCIPVKYDSDKEEYVQTNAKDSGWYSITSRKFPLVAKLKTDESTGIEGIIKLTQCEKIYVWIPSYGKDTNNIYRYCDSDGNIIKYKLDSKKIASYKISDETSDDKITTVKGGYWQKINNEGKPIDNSDEVITDANNDYNTIKNLIFSWED